MIGVAFAADFLLRQVDRAGRVLDSGEIITGMITAMNTSNTTDMAGWAAMNAVIIGIVGYLICPAVKRGLSAIHKRTTARYTWAKNRRNTEVRNG